MPNVTSAAITYDLPTPHRLGGPSQTSGGPSFRDAAKGWGALAQVGNTLLGGWAVNVITSLQSGMPLAVTQATNANAFAGFSLERPNIVGQPSLNPADRTPARSFNTSAFASATAFAIGDSSRDPMRGPAYRDLDLALVKHTPLAEHTDLEFRAEIFDITNTPAFAQPNGSFGSAAFGNITSTTTDPRVIQFALRLSR